VKHIQPSTAIFTGAAGNRLVADVYGDSGQPVLLLHGGGQTRHAWGRTAEHLARAGALAHALDQRGHGDSEWVADGHYAFADFAADAAAVAHTLRQRSGTRPIAIGASLGGVASLLADGGAERAGQGPVFTAIVLVDVTPRVDQSGVDKIQGFMRERATEGFATVAEAADAVAAYLPHRKRPRSHDGLKKNLRLHPDGRWRWHWDPRILQGAQSFAQDHRVLEAALTEAAKAITVPALLVRGGASELVQEAHVREFLELVPHADYIDVAEARHMVAGDSNDRFSDAVLEFVGKLETRG
jgi:pimeloyl-ACP methyl ester carboxylesterase